MKIENIDGITKMTAEKGKILARYEDQEILGKVLWLGKNDLTTNYIEVDEPMEEDNGS